MPPDRREPRALVIVVDPKRQAEPHRDLLIRLFGLTRAEAEVALRVLRGDGLRPISDELTLSLATVKTHLQHVFTKTGTHRQAELVRLLLRSHRESSGRHQDRLHRVARRVPARRGRRSPASGVALVSSAFRSP